MSTSIGVTLYWGDKLIIVGNHTFYDQVPKDITFFSRNISFERMLTQLREII